MGLVDTHPTVRSLLKRQDIPESALKHLKNREGGDREKVYLDSLNNPTAGVGHLLSAEERKQYPVGSSVPQSQRDSWLAKDSSKAWAAAKAQADEVGNPNMAEPLLHVNFQLGTRWNKIHKKTWALMKAGDMKAAATEAANSDWRTQTPDRVMDFQTELRRR